MPCLSIEDFLDNNPELARREMESLMKKLEVRQKRLKESFRIGDVSGAKDALEGLLAEITNQDRIFKEIRGVLEHYDAGAYLEESFDRNFRSAMASEGVTLRGDYPNYEVFPFMVRVNAREGMIVINKNRTRSLRLKTLAFLIKKERERFFKSPFRSEEFLKDLAYAYDGIIGVKELKHKVGLKSQKVPVMEIYRALTPMRRWRREYTPQLFGFHIYRIQKEAIEKPEVIILKDESGERILSLGSVPIGSKGGITIVEENGRETAIGSLSFRRGEKEAS